MRTPPRWLADFVVSALPRFFSHRRKPFTEQPAAITFRPGGEFIEDRLIPGSALSWLGLAGLGASGLAGLAEQPRTGAEQLAILDSPQPSEAPAIVQAKDVFVDAPAATDSAPLYVWADASANS